MDWLNQNLTKMWPFINEVTWKFVSLNESLLLKNFLDFWLSFVLQAASELIKSSLEPVLEQYKSLLLDSLKFSKLTLGTVAPQFTGEMIMQAE